MNTMNTLKERHMYSISQMYQIRTAMKQFMALPCNGYDLDTLERVLDELDEELNRLPYAADEADEGENRS